MAAPFATYKGCEFHRYEDERGVWFNWIDAKGGEHAGYIKRGRGNVSVPAFFETIEQVKADIDNPSNAIVFTGKENPPWLYLAPKATLRALADDAYTVAMWAFRQKMKREQSIDEIVKALEKRLAEHTDG